MTLKLVYYISFFGPPLLSHHIFFLCFFTGDKESDTLLSSEVTSNSLHASTDLSSISSGSSDIVTPSDSNSAEVTLNIKLRS